MARLDEVFNYSDKTVDEYGTLNNKLGIEDSVLLEVVEREITTFKLANMYLDNVSGNFDVDHYLSIHKYLFQDIYPFAGKIRNEIIAKKIPFCLPNLIFDNLKDVLSRASKRYKKINTREELVKFIAELYADLDIIHPFREGNGRCEREFIRQYILKIVKEQKLDNYVIDYGKIDDKKEFIKAVIIAEVNCDTRYLEYFIDKLIVNDNELDIHNSNYKKR